MSQVEEGVNIEHLLVEAMHNMGIPLPEDPLPSAEEIAGAKAAAATAHSTCSAAAVPSQPIKGLGGAGLNLKRKGGSKAGNSSTISAATAPPALLGSRPAPSRAAPGGTGSALGGGPASRAAAPKSCVASASLTTSTAASAPPAAAAAAAAAEEKDGVSGGRAEASMSGVPTSEGDRSMTKDGAGVRSFRTVLTPDSEGSEEWEADNSEVSRKPFESASGDWSSNCRDSCLGGLSGVGQRRLVLFGASVIMMSA